MSKPTELPKDSISSAIIGLKNTFDNIKQQWKPLKEQSNTKQVNELHALGSVNLDKTREEFSHQINSIRNICSQFETEVLGDVMKMGAGADPAFRKHFTHLKEHAALESTVIRLKDTLQSSKALLEVSLREKEESKPKAEIQRLQELAQSMGLVTFVDVSRIESDSPISTITLGGTMIVIDIDIDDKGEVQKVKVTFVSDSMQNDQYAAVDQILKENLQSRKFSLFKRNLWCLALLDQMNVKYKPLDFFFITKNLLEDLRISCVNESEIEPDFSTVLTEGHGIPYMNLDYPGISLAYWLGKPIAMSVDWSEVQESFQYNKNHPVLSKASRLLISFENSVQPMYYLPPSRPSYLLRFDETDEDINEDHFKVVCENSYPRFMSPTRYVKTLSTHPDSVPVPIRFVATVEPPIPMADRLCQNLMSVAGLTKTDVVGQNEIKNAKECLSLEEILVPNIGSTKRHMHDNQVYKWMKSSNTSAKLVSRVPFQHPVQLYSILQCLRQQEMFNALFKSIFSDSDSVVDSPSTVSIALDTILAEEDKYLIIEVAATEAPCSIHLTLSPPQASSFVLIPLSIDIAAEDPVRPTVCLHSSPIHKWNTSVFKSEVMTKELQSHHNIPRFVRWLFERMSKESFVKRDKMDIDDDIYKKSIKME